MAEIHTSFAPFAAALWIAALFASVAPEVHTISRGSHPSQPASFRAPA